MAKVKGIWTFNDFLTDANIWENVNFSADGNNYITITITAGAAAPFRTLNYAYEDEHSFTEQYVYAFEEYDNGIIQIGWENEVYKTIDFGETEQTVSDAFYAWLIENAVQAVSNIKINVTGNGTTTLATAGKYCDRNIDVNVDAVYEAGQKAVYDRFWDAYQENGERENYYYAFSGPVWTDETFKPKYDIIPTIAQYLFTRAKCVDVKACLAYNGVILDLAQCTRLAQTFGYCTELTSLPKIDISSATSNSGTFTDCGALKTIDELVVSADTGHHATNFRNCSNLETMIVSGTIGQNDFNVQWSTKLTHDSLMSIINCLADKSGDTSGTTWTLTIGSTNYAKLTADEIAIAENKGWDVV